MQAREQEGKILMITQVGGEHVSIPSQPRGSRGTPRGTEELAAQHVSSRGVVFPGACSDHVAGRSLITCLSYGDPVTQRR